MALSGSIYGSFNGVSTTHLRPFMTWSITQSIAGNYSDLTVYYYFEKRTTTYSSWNLQPNGHASASTSTTNIDGSNSGHHTPFDLRGAISSYHLLTRTARIDHNADGTRNCWLGWSGDTKVTTGTYNFGSTVTFDTIPRGATISSVGDLTIGDNLPFNVINNGNLWIRMTLEVWNGSSYVSVKTQDFGQVTSGTITLGSTENNIMYQAMPNNTSRSIRIRCFTHSSSAYNNQIGDTSEAIRTVSVNTAINTPTFTDCTIANLDKTIVNKDKYDNVLVSSSSETLTGSTSKIIKGYSKVRAVVSEANKGVALNYATMSKYRLTSDSAYSESDYASSGDVNIDLDNVTTSEFLIRATDSRGLSTSISKSLTLTDYTTISAWDMLIARENLVDSTVTLSFTGRFDNIYFGGDTDGVQNTVVAHYRYKETTVANWTTETWNAITSDLTINGNNISFEEEINGDLGASGFDTEKSFNIEIRLYDKLTNTIISGIIDVGKPVMDITQSGVAFMDIYNDTLGGSLQVDGLVGIYVSGDKFVIAYDDSGTLRYKYLTLSGTGVTWVHTTSKP
jgi:hypothetical protein